MMINKILSTKQTKQIIDKLLSIKIWLYASITIIVVVWLIYAIISLNNNVFGKINIQEQKLKKIIITLNEVNKNIQTTEKLVLLPNLESELEYAKDYFLVYNLIMEKGKTEKTANKQNITIKGKLINTLLAIYDIEKTKLLLHFGDIVIDNDNAIAHITIFGSKRL